MSDVTPTGTGHGQSGPGRTVDPMSADRRMLAIAAAFMVGLVLIGVVSAQLFTRSACTRIDPEPVDDRAVGVVAPAAAGEGIPDVGVVAADALPDLAEGERDAVTAAIASLEGAIGPLRSVADVRGAERLAATEDGLVALGSIVTTFDAQGTEVRATADVDDGTVVGSGPTLFSLALVNQLTGQIDAVQSVDADLDAGTCADTATVGTPLAFHLDAGDGQLLLLRTEEDGASPAVEVRDAGGARSTSLEVGTAPAGVLAERVTGRLGQDAVVVGWRTAGDHDGDAVAALDPTTFELRWTAPAAPLADIARAGDRPLWVDVLAVGETEALVVLRPEEEGDEPSSWPGVVVAIDLEDGTVRWHGEPGGAAPTAAFEGPGGWVVASAEPGRSVVTSFDRSGELVGQQIFDAAAAPPRGGTWEDGIVAVASGPLLLLDADDPSGQEGRSDAHGIAADVAFVDVLAIDDRVHVLARSEEGALLLTFERATSDG